MTPCCSEWHTTVPESVRFTCNLAKTSPVAWFKEKWHGPYRLPIVYSEIQTWFATTGLTHEMKAVPSYATIEDNDVFDLIFADDVDCKLFKMAFGIP